MHILIKIFMRKKSHQIRLNLFGIKGTGIWSSLKLKPKHPKYFIKNDFLWRNFDKFKRPLEERNATKTLKYVLQHG